MDRILNVRIYCFIAVNNIRLFPQIILHSMHKYQPRVHVIRKECGEELSPVRAVPAGEGTRTFSFPETVFTTVTAYQNQQVQHLPVLHILAFTL